MKTKFLLLVLVLCLMPLCAAAQTNGGSAFNPPGMPANTTGTYMDENLFPIPKYEFPVQKLVLDGKEFEARTNVLYKYNGENKRYGLFVAVVSLKPLDLSGMGTPDSLRNHGGCGTYVYHVCNDLKGPVRKVKGKADAYARVFSPHPATDDDKLELGYSVVYDAENPEHNSVEYSLKRARWSKPDKNEYYPRFFREYNRARWEGMTLHDLHFYAPLAGKPIEVTDAKLKARLFCFQMEDDMKNPATAPKDTRPGKVNAYVKFSIEGHDKDGSFIEDNITGSYPGSRYNDIFRCAANYDGKGEVTVEERLPLFVGLSEWLIPNYCGFVGVDFRAKAKCHMTQKGMLAIDWASFSHMISN